MIASAEHSASGPDLIGEASCKPIAAQKAADVILAPVNKETAPRNF